MRSRIFKIELLFALAGLVLVGAFAGPAWALLGALAGLLAGAALKKGAGLLLLKALRQPALWFALLGSIAGALAGGLLWALAGAAGGAVAWLALVELRAKLRGEG
ncbi:MULTISPECIES: hypothetical protein [unclassified Thiomonas]|jgi:hypothetical protein|uniref:hypothetical protein n=1 Tax=unclassified Thiomonas TaxID=2625466 RepID=UPI000BDC75E1|nr:MULTISPECIES: hypothetical protein [unclassified Thiomonas]OZB68852.1 MAG: hypothetical protein B7X30_15050 [Thiomonas sp. 13-64-67]